MDLEVPHGDRRFRRLRRLSIAERASFERAAGSIWAAPSGSLVRHPEEPSDECQLLVQGFAVRYIEAASLPRQVTAFNVPGDFCDLHGLFFPRTNFFVRALTDCALQRFSHAALLAAMEEHPGLARAFWQESLVDAAIGREWLVNIGRRSPLERMAHLLCELLVRLETCNADDAKHHELPIPSHELAAAQVLTEAEVDEILAVLKARRLIEVNDGGIVVVDAARLRTLGLFDQGYLESGT